MSRQEDTILRTVANKALKAEIMTEEEDGFITALIKKYRMEIESKLKQADILRGQIIQLQQNEKMIVDLLDNLVKAAERSKARDEAVERVRGKSDEDEVETPTDN